MNTAYAAADSGEKTVTYGALIHNKTVTERLSALGVSAVSDISDIQPGDNVIIRAHGISEAEQEKIEAAGGRITDATCPYVKKIHSIVRSASEEGKTVVIAGNPNHPEVMGIKGRCKNSAYVFSSAYETAA